MQQYMNNYYRPMVNQPQHIVRPVASVEEARAMQTDFSGALTIMPDVVHGYIFTKQLDLSTGCAEFAAYQRVPMERQTASQYVSREEFNALTQRLNALYSQLGGEQREHAGNANAANDEK